MARPLRVEYAGALYHVMNRGNRRETVFRTRRHYGILARQSKNRQCRKREARQLLMYLGSCHCRCGTTLIDMSEELRITLPGLTAARACGRPWQRYGLMSSI